LKLSQELRAIVESNSLLEHPFYQAWTRGALSLQDLKLYAGQYYRQVEAFPRWVSSVHSRCPEISARKVLLENLVDEEIHGTDHPTLWRQFGNACGLSDAELAAAPVLPSTREAVDAYYAMTSGDWTFGLCALYAYEVQVPEVSKSKVDGLQAHYGISQDGAVAFFREHMKYDVRHSEAAAALIDRHGDRQTATAATTRASEALWSFLDGVSEAIGLSC